jgi:hypothetical protein
MSVQWVHLGEGETLVAAGRGAWIQRSQTDGFGLYGPLGLSGPMPDDAPASITTTRNLLDGAIAAAERAAAPVTRPPMTLDRWAADLAGQWYCAHHSVALLPELTQRFADLHRADLADFALEKLEEERGHDAFPLADLRALGYDADEFVLAVGPTSEADAMVQYARECARGDHPIDFLGYAYTLERRVLRLSAEWFADVEAVLPPGVDAMSGVRAHASRFDADHVEQAITFFTRLPGRDRARIAASCYRTTQISCAALAAEHAVEQGEAS